MLSTVLMLLLDVAAGTPLDLKEVKVRLVLGLKGGDVVDVGSCAVVVVSAGVGMSRDAEEGKALLTSCNSMKVCNKRTNNK